MDKKTKRSDRILKIIIFQKVTTGILQLFIAYGFYTIIDTGVIDATQRLSVLLQFSMENYYVQLFLNSAGDTKSATLFWIAVAFFIFGIGGFIEAYGLHRRERWAEWLVVCFTGSFIPFELYELYMRPGWLIFITLVVTCTIVYFVGKHNELFHSFKWKKEIKAAANLEGTLDVPLSKIEKKPIKVRLQKRIHKNKNG